MINKIYAYNLAFCADSKIKPHSKPKAQPPKPKETMVLHTDDYKTFDTVIVKTYPDSFDGAFSKACMGYTKQDIKTTPVNKVKLDARRGVTIEQYDKKGATIKQFRVNQNHDISKNTANLERWQQGETVWIKIPIKEKFVKPRAELIENGRRIARIVLNEKGENIASERDEYSKEDMEKLYSAMKSLIDEAKAENIDFPFELAQKIFKI